MLDKYLNLKFLVTEGRNAGEARASACSQNRRYGHHRLPTIPSVRCLPAATSRPCAETVLVAWTKSSCPLGEGERTSLGTQQRSSTTARRKNNASFGTRQRETRSDVSWPHRMSVNFVKIEPDMSRKIHATSDSVSSVSAHRLIIDLRCSLFTSLSLHKLSNIDNHEIHHRSPPHQPGQCGRLQL